MVKLFPPRERLFERLDEARDLIVTHKDALKLETIVVFGSLARGTADYRSDIDLLLVIHGTPEDSSKAKDYILENFYNQFEGEFPQIDAHTCCDTDLYKPNNKLNGTPYGDFLECIRREGVAIWQA